ncbi:hypothetical protein OIU76_012176 [Salix suchowensis]|nr:hypothetical protein OIU76_012176 [Salix suchowensis]
MEVSSSIFAINIHHCSSFFLGLLLLLASALSLANAKTHYHDFVIQATPVKRLCKTQNSITVNGMFPGPTLEVNNGDTLVVNVVNKAKYNTALLLGEWWNANPIDVVREATRTGGAPNSSDAYTFNGQPGDLYNCSSQDTVIVPIDSGETNLLRVVNSALNQPLFFTVANHQLTVVGADASYVKPFTTSVLMLGPGQTTDVLISADQSPSRYYMAARAYQSAQNAPFDNTTTTAILEYKSSTCAAKNCSSNKPIMPPLPAYNDTATVTTFTKSFRSTGKNFVPTDIDENLFFTIGLGLNPCPPNFNKSSQCQGPNGTRFTASMNNVSFVLPSNFSLLQAHHQRIQGVFTTDFPANPPRKFDYTENGVGELQSIESPPEDLPLC